jgi:hypothetical protein
MAETVGQFMEGRKTKWGVIAAAIGGACLAVVPILQTEFYQASVIFNVIGTFLAVGGGGLATYGVARKIEKSGTGAPKTGGNGAEGGFIRFAVLVTLLLAALLIITACAHTVPPEKSICADRTVGGDSLICTVTSRHGYTPEDLNGVLLDGTALASIADPGARDAICTYLGRIRTAYDAINGDTTWFDLLAAHDITIVGLSAYQQMLVWQVVQRRVPIDEYRIDVPISKNDDSMLRKAWSDQWKQLGCE